jgi:hypothetical protein
VKGEVLQNGFDYHGHAQTARTFCPDDLSGQNLHGMQSGQFIFNREATMFIAAQVERR